MRAEADADLHFEGTGEFAWGTKWVIVAARGDRLRHRIILDVAPVPDKGGEAAIAVDPSNDSSPLLAGAQGVVYDTALRGVHHQRIMRNLGLLSINRVALAKAGAKKPRRRKAEQRAGEVDADRGPRPSPLPTEPSARRPCTHEAARSASADLTEDGSTWLRTAAPGPDPPPGRQVRQIPLVQRLRTPRRPRRRRHHRSAPRQRRGRGTRS